VVNVTFSEDAFDENGCKAVTPPCDLEQYIEVAAPTASSDRVCEQTTTTTSATTTTTTATTTTTTTTVHSVCGLDFAAEEVGSGHDVTGQFESLPPTNITDRECTDITECNYSVEYETVPPTVVNSNYPTEAVQLEHAISDRTCSNLTVCNATEYERTPAEYNVDRTCAALTAPCNLDAEYEAVSPDVAVDRVCKRISRECRVGEYERLVPTSTSDRVCDKCSRGSIDEDEDPSTPCILCQGGTYQNLEGARQCIDSTNVCPVGTEEIEAATTQAARVCRLCNGVSQFQDLAGQTSCKNVSACPAGTIIISEPAAGTDRGCQACDGVTEFQDKSMALYCVPFSSVCGYGFYESMAGTSTSDRTCARCEDGTYQDQLDQSACLPTSVCQAGSMTARAATAASDVVCIACDGVTGYQDADDAVTCKQVTQCDAETEFAVVPATAITDATCGPLTACSSDEFVDGTTATGDRRCTAHHTCAWPDEYEFQPPTSSTDRICAGTTECRENHFEVVPSDAEDSVELGSGDAVEADSSSISVRTQDRVCEKCTRCSSFGEYESVACSATNDAECSVCAECTDGKTFESNVCSKTTNAVCTPCTACGGSIVTTAFGDIYVGEFAAEECTAENDTTCQACSQCETGEYEVQRCTPTSDTVCTVQCGYVQSSDPVDGGALIWAGVEFNNAGLCKEAISCGEGEWEAAKPTPSSDRVCQLWSECVSLSSEDSAVANSDGSGASGGLELVELIELVNSMDATFEVIAPTPISDRQCKAATVCSTDEFQTVAPTITTDRVCNTLTVCANNTEYVSVEATAISDRACRTTPSCTNEEELTEAEEELEGEGSIVLSCTILASVSLAAEERQAAIGASAGIVVGMFCLIVLVVVLSGAWNTDEGTFVVLDPKYRALDHIDSLDPASAKLFWLKFEKGVEIIPRGGLRKINKMNVAAVKKVHEAAATPARNLPSESEGESDVEEDHRHQRSSNATPPMSPVPTTLPDGTDPQMLQLRLKMVTDQLSELSAMPAPGAAAPMSPMMPPATPLNAVASPYLHLSDVTVTQSEIDEDIDTRL
jgi:hypothetical protein